MTDENTSDNESLLKFPCDFTLKVFGLKSDAFELAVLTIAHKHIPHLAENAIQTRSSENEKYLALSLTVHVTSRQQLDDLYRDLTSSPQVLMVL